jgi:hypothetical protein
MKSPGVVLISLAVALIAQFPLESWADQNDVAHWIQHGLIFWAGIGVGAGLLALYQRGQHRV